jgi:3-deoxy-D-manno-octulosonic-acid transferase
MLFFYNLGIRLYGLIISLIAPFNAKAKKWKDGRKNWASDLAQKMQSKKAGQPVFWLHASSLGEFEQGRPIIEALKKAQPDLFIVLSFFSPSGYEIRKNYNLADVVTYLPLDTKSNAKRFLQIIQADFVVFVKYEFWHHFLYQLEQQKTSTYLISAVFRPNQLFFKPYGKFFRNILQRFQHIFVQNESSFQLLQNIKLTNITLSGDTRIDRVFDISQTERELPILDHFCGNAPVWVIGSSWPPDETFIFDYLHNDLPENWKLIIAPHDISKKHIQQIEQQLQVPFLRYSVAEEKDLDHYRVLIIDNIGMLAFLYRYGKIAYIGGAFGEGLHNTLEAIVYGLPVVFGPKYKKFEEARYLVDQKGGFCISDKEDLKKTMDHLLEEANLAKAAKTAKNYILQNQGASQQISEYLSKKHL